MSTKFSFKWVDQKGQPQGFLSKNGSIDGDVLTLDGKQIPVAAIADVDVRGQYLVLAIMTGDDQASTVVLHTGRAAELKTELGRLRSAVWADMHQQHLDGKGQGHTFRREVCPSCAAVIDLTGLEPTPQVSCPFCHTISTIAADDEVTASAGDPESGYRLCDECGMYSKPRQFTIFYFYFLIVFYGWHSRTTFRCPICMRGDAWKMLFGNLLFVLGVPVALVQLFRSYGGTDIGAHFPGLDKANILARKGDLDGAIAAYQTLLSKRPVAAGVKYNIGLALLHQNRPDQAARMFEFALADCANYGPARAALASCYRNLGETEKLAALQPPAEA